MRKTMAIFEKEFKSFFFSPMAYIIIGSFTIVVGLFFYLYLSNFIESAMRDQITSQQYQQMPQRFNINLMLIRPYFWNIALISLFFLPAVTMRLYSEEKKQGTIELLNTTPLTSLQIILGKFSAGLAFYVVLLIPTMFFQSLLFVYGDPEFLPVLSGYLGLLLLGSAFISIGLFISTMTENQIIAAIAGFAISFLFWLIGWGANYTGPVFAPILQYASIITHFEDFAQGIIDSTHVIYYILFSLLGIYLSLKSVESIKWRT
jgi:ABC-2 type transport system permease protein